MARSPVARLRGLINAADPRLQEDWNWSTPVCAYKGNVCAIGALKDHVKVNFFKVATIPDPQDLFNGGLDAKASRSIDITEGDVMDDTALQGLMRAAASHND